MALTCLISLLCVIVMTPARQENESRINYKANNCLKSRINDTKCFPPYTIASGAITVSKLIAACLCRKAEKIYTQCKINGIL